MIAIIGAMEIEIETILSKMSHVEEKVVCGVRLHKGQLAGKDVVVALCGIGKVNAAHATSIILSAFDISCIINTGVAGGADANVDIGDVVVSSYFVQHDFNVHLEYAYGQVPGMESAYYSANASLVNLAKATCDKVLQESKAHVGRIATGDQFVNSKEAKEAIYKKFSPLCVEMEGAAIAHICTLTDTPFVGIRAVSDKADGTADEDFAAFARKAANISAEIVMEMVPQIDL